ncbi:MAG: LPS export ABC transporter periplasmic protein LptC [Winogradskyella sp.]|uniref:LPS export ABC transporter periplasmic protein LptC n=1 Tax=Winogradskyella sp. TaxID=1883156 RepID=UPI0018469C11|nr:LPS export ABC transporter periplasmic protein LptC [Winogradskyella sp.]MBT8245577.1 LPS export ABC transporter periplasmic protein LptC [Winogradskyella sp.]NNK22847.1 LPS export ABC transporter periplasmic protein LptC [Winogradskyella sp.]
MNRSKLHIVLNTVIALVMTVFFSCKNNFKDVQQVGVLQNEPIVVADTINLKYTDSFKLRANLLSPKMLDYSNRNFAFSEFPEGIELIIYDEAGNESKIFSDYAIVYSETDLIDLRGNVILTTHKQDSLFTSQMYFDEKKEWIFTNEAVRLRSQGTDVNGTGFDSDRNFEEYEMLAAAGDIEVNN